MKDTYDVILIGAGHNGLVAAAYLARAGQRVLVLERRSIVGGAAVTEEVWPGYRVDTCAHALPRLAPQVVRDLDVGRHGLEFLRSQTSLFAPARDGGCLAVWEDKAQTAEGLRRFSPADADKWTSFSVQLAKFARFLEAVHATTPPRITDTKVSEVLPVLNLVRRMRGLGKQDMVEFLRALAMPVAEFLDDWFETDLLKGALGAIGVTGLFQAPRAIGTTYHLLHHLAGGGDGRLRPSGAVRGGIGQVSQALAAAARGFGAEIRTGVEVAQIIVNSGRATGVVLRDGEEVEARVVASNADPKRTFLGLVDPLHLDTEFLRAVRNLKFKAACAKVNLALSELPKFTCLGAADGSDQSALLRSRISISPDLDYLERAFDDAKYGDYSRQPYLEAVIPTLTDPSLAPASRHVMSILVQYVPYRLNGGWTYQQCEALGDLAVNTLAEYAPNLPAAVLHRQVLTPLDLEQTYGLTEGNANHGEHTLDQFFFMRPVPGWAQYRTPVDGLYLCGAGAHPGGGVTGMPGRNAAREILKDVAR